MKPSNKLPFLKRFEIRLSGTGGQGVITLGKILGTGLALGHGYNVTQTQSYGPEARGGASRTDLVVSSLAISYPKTEKLDLLVALSQDACNAYYSDMKKGGVLLVDSGLVKQVPTSYYLGLPFTEMATTKLKLPQAMNTIVLGALSHLLPFAKANVMRQALTDALPAKIIEVNKKAFKMGITRAQKDLGPPPTIWEASEQTEDVTNIREVNIVSEV
ncbi:2-oxoacid:acceptor oxidoreductase family protein [Desulfovibrio inopinatus]|uniref:2-oxoacid:acceptor oxidoreductase family protein n=1 Tax=Desulfovibrio inopinatus TaxID=102109 RepID=UPI0003F7FDC0|nr:2-oxoacid:acceptor oxidoreductase family protein [Desulfovibrio inopinatus]